MHEAAPRRCWLFTAHARRSWFDAAVLPAPGDALVFGRESVGLPKELVEAHPEDTVAIPIFSGVRSHNLANAVAIALYEGLRKVAAI